MNPEPEAEKNTVTFHLIKSPHFQTLRVDGTIGNLTANGLSLTFFVERGAVPNEMTYEIQSDGSLGSLVAARGKAGLVRELQTSLLLDVTSARNLMELLGTMLENFESEERAN